jgi:hypothetical protein
MRNRRLTKAALPFLAGAALIGSTMAPAASADATQTAHGCGATVTFLHKLESFVKVYDKGSSKLGTPGTSQAALAAYLNKASKFFNTSANEWAAAGKYAPSSVTASFEASVLQLKKTAADFSAAGDAVKADKLSAMTTDIKAAEKDSTGFGKALEPLVRKCA